MLRFVNSTTETARAGVTSADLYRAVSLLERADRVALACHVNPDGDALGSMLAVAQVLRAAGKDCTASFGEPFTVPHNLRFLPGLELLAEPADFPAAPEVMVAFDAGSLDRLGGLAANAMKAEELLVVDHHASNTGYGTAHLVDPHAAATAVLAERLIVALGMPITHEVALSLYVGLVTDTGSFRRATTTPAVHALAARLLATGIQPEEVAGRLWENAPFGYLQALSGVLGRARLEPEAARGRGLVWTTVTRADRAAYGLSYDQVEGVVDVLRGTAEAELVVVLKETDDGAWYGSTRSKGDVDVGRICTRLGGGGGPGMAGFLWRGFPAEAIGRFRDALSRATAPL
ncbi:MAG: bifunctional oligoribonuclease/PAP phosphatase NrnA [Streptosporangiales bacterium]|nr:bifunctional oligoribonuclease/PAP phosphatase NrnA [Streptosporangiales bacterium]